MKRVLGGLLAVGLLTTGGCSGGGPNPAPADLPSSSSPAGTPGSSSASGSGTPQSSAAAECLSHRFQLLRFVAVGGNQAYGTGEGGDVYITFRNQSGNDGSVADQTYRLEGLGKDPIRLTLAGVTGDLTVDGTTEGTYQLQGTQVTFTSTTSEGSATLKAGGRTQKLPMTDVAAIVAPKGSAAVTCTDKALTLTAESVRFESLGAERRNDEPAPRAQRARPAPWRRATTTAPQSAIARAGHPCERH